MAIRSLWDDAIGASRAGVWGIGLRSIEKTAPGDLDRPRPGSALQSQGISRSVCDDPFGKTEPKFLSSIKIRIRVGFLSTKAFDDGGMTIDEVLGFLTGEDSRGGADRADTACADCGGEEESMRFVESFDEACDIARVEGVAPSRSVDELDGVCFEFDLKRIGKGDDALASSRDDDVFGAELVERRGLAIGVGIVEDEFGFVFVGEEDIGVG